MVDIKELAEANRHCRDNNCTDCPFQYKKEECASREALNNEIIIEYLDMIGFNPSEK